VVLALKPNPNPDLQVICPQAALDVDVILAAGKNTGLKLPGMPLTLPDVFAGAHALEYPVSSGAIIDYSLRGAPHMLRFTWHKWF